MLHMDHVEDYTSSSTCRRQRLLDYFGDEQADLVAPCDGCDICRGHSRSGRPASSDRDDSVVGKALKKLSGFFRSG